MVRLGFIKDAPVERQDFWKSMYILCEPIKQPRFSPGQKLLAYYGFETPAMQDARTKAQTISSRGLLLKALAEGTTADPHEVMSRRITERREGFQDAVAENMRERSIGHKALEWLGFETEAMRITNQAIFDATLAKLRQHDA